MNDFYYPLFGSTYFGLSAVNHQEHHLINCITYWFIRAGGLAVTWMYIHYHLTIISLAVAWMYIHYHQSIISLAGVWMYIHYN
jgi:hypothetical protein